MDGDLQHPPALIPYRIWDVAVFYHRQILFPFVTEPSVSAAVSRSLAGS